MPRVLPGHATRQRHKRMLKKASGYWGSRSKLFRPAKQAIIKAGQYAFRDRRAKKRDFRGLFVLRVSAACDARGLSYSKFMGALRRANIALNRKMLSEIAIHDPAAFDRLVAMARSATP
ncbi:MAG: 50S ribosomal protein L20 [Phycisphaerales bacterium]|nr:50S ribosomal protein L20 [Phycisphaerales bacterium]